MTNNVKRLFSNRDRIGYALGDMGCNLSFSLLSTYMMLFYIQYIGLSAENWAWIIIVSKVWDAINDILIGNMVDRKRISGKSKFMPWITIGSAVLIVFTVMVFAPVKSFSQAGKAIWCLVSYCLWSVAFTAVNVPYGSLNSVITDKPRERTSLSMFRSIGASAGVAAVMILPSVIYDKNNKLVGDRLFYIAIVFSVLGFFILLAMRRMVTERVEYSGETPDTNYIKTVKSFFTNRAMVGATLATVASIVFFTSTVSVNNLVFQYYFGDAGKTTIATFASYVPMVVFLPLTGTLVSKFGKKNYAAATALVSVIACAALVFIPVSRDLNGIIVWVAGLMVANIGNSAFQLVVWAIIADCIEVSMKKTGIREESSLYAMYSFFRKLAQGIGSAVVAVSLSAVGFVEGDGAIQPDRFCSGVKVLYAALISFGTVIMFICMKFIYNINKTDEQNLSAK